MPLKLMMSVLEVSADVHAAFLAKELKGCRLFGMGGERMRAAGVDVRIDATEKSSVGILESIKHLPSHLSTLSKMKKMLDMERPDALILIDAQGFNMLLAQYARKKGIKTVYYIAPQEWLWGTSKGVKKVAGTIDLIISIFKKEHEIFTSAGGNSFYFGHPLLDIVKKDLSREEFCKKAGINPEQKIVALCPGSRHHEISRLLPVLIDIARKMKGVQFVLPVSSSKFKKAIEEKISRSRLDIKIVDGSSYDAIGNADLVIASSGTIILECVCLGTPVIMFYKLSWLTYYIAKHLMRISLPYYSMPNILAGRMVVPEYVMERATSENMYKEALGMLNDPNRAKAGYDEVRSLLGNTGAIKKAAQKIIEFAGSRP